MNGLFEVLLEASVRSLLLAGLVYAMLWTIRVRRAAWRHAAWTAVLGSMLLMPLLPGLFPPVSVEVPIAAEPLTTYVVEPARVVTSSAPIPALPPPAAVFDWNRVWLGLYIGGALVLALRLFLGWLSARRLLRNSVPIASLRAYESSRISAPMTMGVFAPKVLLPLAWRDWPADVLETVLLHERAHVARRDTAVAVLARINTCVFWFHPLAWALERTLAATAEYACDAAALKVLGARERYAEVLVSMAWQRVPGVGFGGVGLLEKRVDRVLEFRFAEPVSRWRKAALILGCAAAVVASCSRTVTPLQDDPKWVESRKQMLIREANRRMTPGQVADLEAAVAKNPEDFDSRRKLLEFYAMNRPPALLAHILWLVANHPENELAGSWEIRFADPAWNEQVKPLWLRAVRRPSVSPAVLANAATYFLDADKVLAEELLLRGQKLDPGDEWSRRLGELYYRVIMGSNSPFRSGVIRSVSLAEAHGPQATAVRAKLATTRDAVLLRTTGMRLVMDRGVPRRVDFDSVALGRSYLDRSIELDPQSPRTRRFLAMLKAGEARLIKFSIPFRESYEAVAELPENERLAWLMQVASSSLLHGDADGKPEHRMLTRKCVQEILRLAPTKRNDPYYSKAVLSAHVISGLLAMEEGDRPRAVRHMQAATEVPPVDYLAQTAEFPCYRLAAWLLKDGERETVITFLERLAAMPQAHRESLLEAAAAIRKGIRPSWYPRPPL